MGLFALFLGTVFAGVAFHPIVRVDGLDWGDAEGRWVMSYVSVCVSL